MSVSRRYQTYLIFVLMAVQALCNLDRMFMSMSLESIKTDLGLSDIQLGLLSGMAFALFYSVLGIPIARYIDRGDRPRVASICMGFYSVGTSLCAAVSGFWQLAFMRMFVGIGEAGCIPVAHSLIGETFERTDRARAVSRFLLGTPIATVLGFLIGGWLLQSCGWRVLFIGVSVPGAIVALLSLVTLREPRRLARRVGEEVASQVVAANIRTTVKYLLSNATYRKLLLAFSMWYFFGFGLTQWLPTFFMRTHGMQPAELGLWLALTSGICGLIGTIAGGEWASRFAARKERLQLLVVATAFLAYGLINMGVYISRDRYEALTFLAVASVCGPVAYGPLFGALQTVIPASMRATGLALVYLLSNLIGMGLGPLAAGFLSELLAPTYGQQSLQAALLILSPGYFIASVFVLAASRTVESDAGLAEAYVGLRLSSSIDSAAHQIESRA